MQNPKGTDIELVWLKDYNSKLFLLLLYIVFDRSKPLLAWDIKKNNVFLSLNIF